MRKNKLAGDDLYKLGALFPKMYKIKLGENNIKSLENVQKLLKGSAEIIKIELKGNPCCDAEYKAKLFGEFDKLECIDQEDKTGGTVESTLYDNEDEEVEFDEEEDDFDGEDEDDEEDMEDMDEDEDDEDEDDEDDEEEEKPPKKHKKN